MRRLRKKEARLSQGVNSQDSNNTDPMNLQSLYCFNQCRFKCTSADCVEVPGCCSAFTRRSPLFSGRERTPGGGPQAKRTKTQSDENPQDTCFTFTQPPYKHTGALVSVVYPLQNARKPSRQPLHTPIVMQNACVRKGPEA